MTAGTLRQYPGRIVVIMIAALGLNRRVQGFVSARQHRVVVPKSCARGCSF